MAVTKGGEFVTEVGLHVRANLRSWVLFYGEGIFCTTWTTCVGAEMEELATCSSLNVIYSRKSNPKSGRKRDISEMQVVVGVLYVYLAYLLKSDRNDSLMQFEKQKLSPVFDERGGKLLDSSYGVLHCHRGVI